MKTICIEPYLFTKSSFEQLFINSLKKIYQHAGKCDDQQNIKDIIYADMLSTLEGVTDNSPNLPMTSTPVNKPSARKSLCLFTNILYVKWKAEKCIIVDAKSKHRAMKIGNNQCTKKEKTERSFKNQWAYQM